MSTSGVTSVHRCLIVSVMGLGTTYSHRRKYYVAAASFRIIIVGPCRRPGAQPDYVVSGKAKVYGVEGPMTKDVCRERCVAAPCTWTQD